MNERSWVRLYQAASRGWLVAALASLVLPAAERGGTWLPLHLVLAGGVSVAICGAIILFSQVMTAGPPQPPSAVWTQFISINLGVALIAFGVLRGPAWVVAVGGSVMGAALILLAWMVLRARRRGLNKRHVVPLGFYLSGIGCVVVGVLVGALVASGVTPFVIGLRNAHVVLNVLGWASFAIAGTLVTLFPTVLKVRMVAWSGRPVLLALVVGVGLFALGLVMDADWMAVAGAILYLVGAIGVAWMMIRTMRSPRSHGFPLVARHMVAAAAWWLVGAAWLVWVLVDGAAFASRDASTSMLAMRVPFLAVFVGGWVVQTLLGTWMYVLPLWRPAPPERRAAWLRFMERGRWLQVLAINVGLVLWVAGAGSVGGPVLLAGLVLALGKSLSFPLVGRQIA